MRLININIIKTFCAYWNIASLKNKTNSNKKFVFLIECSIIKIGDKMKKYMYLAGIILCFLLTTACTADQNKSLTCIKGSGEDKITIKYSFKDGKAYLLDWTIDMPNKAIENAVTYEAFFNKINDIKGCSGVFTKNGDGTYTTNQVCDLSKMTNEDVKAVYSQDKKELQQTRKKIINKHKELDSELKCN